MSLFYYIAFPRKADTKCLKSKYDKSKSVKVKDIKGTKWEREYGGGSDDALVYLGNISDLQELFIYEKQLGVTLKRVFENEYIYSMDAKFKSPEPLIPDASIEELLDEIEKQDGVRMTREEYFKQSGEHRKNLAKMNMSHVARCRKQLYDLVKFNTTLDETVEIYCGLVNESNFKFGPPKEIISLTIGEILTSELLDLRKGLKIEIRNTL